MTLPSSHPTTARIFNFRLLTAATFVALLGTTAVPAQAAGAGRSPVLISQPGPAPGPCRPSANAVVADADDEPSVAADPRNPYWLVAAWRADGANAAAAAWSHDGGRSWHRVAPPQLTRCADRTEDHITNVWVSIGPDGIAYLAVKAGIGGGHLAGIEVTTSADGGQTWTVPTHVQPLVPTHVQATVPDLVEPVALYNDKPTIVADPARPGHAYLAWRGDANAVANPIETVLFSRTTDGGSTWSTPSVAHLSSPGAFEVPHLVAFGDGTLEDLIITGNVAARNVAYAGGPGELVTVLASNSNDGGLTWSPPRTVVTYTDSLPVAGSSRTSAGVIFAAATEGRNAFLAYQDASNGRSTPDRIRLVSSADDGATWSSPRTVAASHTPFYPMVAATPHRLVVGFYDLRRATPSQPLLADVWARESDDNGMSWAERHVDGPFDYSSVHGGDYQAAAASGSHIGLVYTRLATTGGNGPDDIYYAEVTPPPEAPMVPWIASAAISAGASMPTPLRQTGDTAQEWRRQSHPGGSAGVTW